MIFGLENSPWNLSSKREPGEIDLSKEAFQNNLNDDSGSNVQFWEEGTEEERQAEIEEFKEADGDGSDDLVGGTSGGSDVSDQNLWDGGEEGEPEEDIPLPPGLPSYKPSGILEVLKNLFKIDF